MMYFFHKVLISAGNHHILLSLLIIKVFQEIICTYHGNFSIANEKNVDDRPIHGSSTRSTDMHQRVPYALTEQVSLLH